MAIRVVGLNDALRPACELMLERNDHAIVIRDGVRVDLGDSAEASVGAGRHRWSSALRSGKRTETVGIGARINRHLVNPVMSKITDATRTMDAESLLPIEAPSLKLRRV